MRAHKYARRIGIVLRHWPRALVVVDLRLRARCVVIANAMVVQSEVTPEGLARWSPRYIYIYKNICELVGAEQIDVVWP